MKKIIMHNIIKIVSIIIVSGLILALTSNSSFAMSDVTGSNWSNWNPENSGTSRIFRDKANTILGIIQVIGIIASVATLAYIGIKFMLGSIEEKANYKQTLLPWLVGATMVFAITTVPSLIYKMVNPSDVGAGETEIGSYLEGMSEVADELFGLANENLSKKAHEISNELYNYTGGTVDGKKRVAFEVYHYIDAQGLGKSDGPDLIRGIRNAISYIRDNPKGDVNEIAEYFNKIKDFGGQEYGKYIVFSAAAEQGLEFSEEGIDVLPEYMKGMHAAAGVIKMEWEYSVPLENLKNDMQEIKNKIPATTKFGEGWQDIFDTILEYSESTDIVHYARGVYDMIDNIVAQERFEDISTPADLGYDENAKYVLGAQFAWSQANYHYRATKELQY